MFVRFCVSRASDFWHIYLQEDTLITIHTHARKNLHIILFLWVHVWGCEKASKMFVSPISLRKPIVPFIAHSLSHTHTHTHVCMFADIERRDRHVAASIQFQRGDAVVFKIGGKEMEGEIASLNVSPGCHLVRHCASVHSCGDSTVHSSLHHLSLSWSFSGCCCNEESFQPNDTPYTYLYIHIV